MSQLREIDPDCLVRPALTAVTAGFERNAGQAADDVRYLAELPGARVLVVEGEKAVDALDRHWLHRNLHHARVRSTRWNFANVAPWVDLLFGTFKRPTGQERWALGLPSPWPAGYLAQLVHPFRRHRGP